MNHPNSPQSAAKFQSQQNSSLDAYHDEEEEVEEVNQFVMATAVPSWGISFVVHLILIVIAGLITFSTATTLVQNQAVVEDEEEVLVKPEKLPDPITPNTVKLDEVIDPQPVVDKVNEPRPPESPIVDPTDPSPNPNLIADSAPKNLAEETIFDETADNSTFINSLPSSDTDGQGRFASTRFGLNKSKRIREGGGSPATEKAVVRGLIWLSRHQNQKDGGWSFDHIDENLCKSRCRDRGMGSARSGATGMAILPFLASNETHVKHKGRYKKVVQGGLNYLKAVQKKDGSFTHGNQALNMYAHGLASIAVCEAYGMTRDVRLKKMAQRSIDFIVFAQDLRGDKYDLRGGGWRYRPKQRGDLSVSGWQIMALKSALLCYDLHVPPRTVKGAIMFLDSVQNRPRERRDGTITYGGSYYGYTGRGRKGGRPTMTSVGLLMRMYTGWSRTHKGLVEGVEFISDKGPDLDGDMYYNYYASQTIIQQDGHKGEKWHAWNDKLKPFLLKSQVVDQDSHAYGSWFHRTSREHGLTSGGRLMHTAFSTLNLQIYYRHSPLFTADAIDKEFEIDKDDLPPPADIDDN